MSRRKQTRPVRLVEDGTSAPAEEATGSEDEGGSSCGEGGVCCPGCQTEVGSMGELEDHLKDCRGGKAATGGPEEEARRQDAENNNSSVEESVGERAELGLVAGHVTLEALQNTKVAVAQFAATAMANNADNAAALQELAVLQSTLYTLQQQQVLQLNLIHQLQQQLQITRTKDGPAPPSPSPKPITSPEPIIPASQSVPATPPPRPVTPTPPPKTLVPEPSASLPPCSVSSSFASSIITNLDPPPSPSEPNTLEMLQRRAQEVLDNASQGLLANNLADELAFRKSKGSLSPYDSKSGRNEPFFKHRCRYCGKVFGSDSALQIHIRSHTGERPFKCNVCGSRFTTKGNLKVHFQRHTVKFPHIKMNPNPVPEHLDKYHPPLLAQMGAHQSLPPGVSPPPFPTGSQFGLPMYRPSHPSSLDGSLSRPIGVFGPRIDPQDVPENLSKSVSQPSPQSTADGDGSEQCKRELDDIGKDSIEGDSLPIDGSSRLSPKHEFEGEYDSEQPMDRYPSPTSYDECSFDSKYTSEDVIGDRESPGLEKNDDSLQEQPENLSNKSMSNMDHSNLTNDSRIPPPIQFPCIISPSSSASSGSVHRLTPRGFGSEDPSKDPAIYSNMLPRPGSTDNSWESLIEIDKSSETSKLQALVDNIEHKLTDPNQCVVCFRVLSCKSALQMHYRTHTGERPFRCKICGRAFTTKGNLKTHMGVHRIKPPMRTLHQCPVCHKKFTNGLVLQQHIRLHTGEPTDLTPDQIQAAEIKDPPPDPPPPFSALFSHSFPLNKNPPSHVSVGLQPQSNDSECNNNIKDDQKSNDNDHDNDNDNDHDNDPLDDCRAGSVSPISDAAFSTSLNALENQVRTITNMSFQNNQKHIKESEDSNLANDDFGPVAVNGSGCDDSEGGCSRDGSSGGGCTPPAALDLSGAAAGHPHIPSGGAPHQQVPSIFPPFPPGLLPPPPPQAPPSPLISSALSSLTSSVLTSTTFNPLALTVNHPGDRRFTGRGNTTCQLCFKTFACHSALEIHYRSHTKERPFKCTICDRGFSTKRSGPCAECQVWLQGNMKQHMLTHKIRDMPAHLFDQQSRGESASTGTTTQTSAPPSAPSTPTTPRPMTPLKDDVEIPSRPPSEPPQRPSERPPSRPDSSDEGSITIPTPPSKRPPPLDHSDSIPAAKRPHSLPNSKHLCHVCNKNFSSSSALQIHMRTHTGDKPFRCTICHKAFTTKGNLKVHMGTHMWTNGASRRGRRMSLELPPLAPQVPPHPPQLKDSPDSYPLPRPRPDLFYPYLPAPFLNGIHQKVSELASTGQLTGGGNGITIPSLGGFGMDLKSERASPEPKIPMPTSLWYFERRPPGGDPASPCSEGLTA